MNLSPLSIATSNKLIDSTQPHIGTNLRFSRLLKLLAANKICSVGSFTANKAATTPYLGANGAIPALTLAMPNQFADMNGSSVLYATAQLSNINGGANNNIYYFISVLNQAQAWMQQTNEYVAVVNAAESKSLSYYGADNYQDLVTQGLAAYSKSPVALSAITKSGKLVSVISTGEFGTANAVAAVMINNGLGAVGGLKTKLEAAGVNFLDIYNQAYTTAIQSVLATITAATDLETIQSVLETTAATFTSPNDYCSITNLTGQENTTNFADMAAMGKDLFARIPRCTVPTGEELAGIISKLDVSVHPSVDNIATSTAMLGESDLAFMRSHLPVNKDSKPIGLYNIIGLASGYLNDSLTNLLDALKELQATGYYAQLMTAMEDIRGASPLALPLKVRAYYALLSTIVDDPATSDIAARINSNYLTFTENLYYEYQNFRLAQITADTTANPLSVLSFVQSLGFASEDLKNILKGMRQPSESGYLIEAVVAHSTNTAVARTLGKRPTDFSA